MQRVRGLCSNLTSNFVTLWAVLIKNDDLVVYNDHNFPHTDGGPHSSADLTQAHGPPLTLTLRCHMNDLIHGRNRTSLTSPKLYFNT